MSSTSPEPLTAGGATRVIAHRGASGYLPEHTLAAKAFAYALGADFIEQDVIATRDGELVVLHDTWLDEVSDVALHFPDRKREDGHYYVVDFTLAELGTLTLAERRRAGGSELRYPGRFPFELEAFRIVSFEEEIRLVAGLNASTGRHVGIYPEIKDPGWHLAEGIDLAELVHAALSANRELISGPVFLQSFDANSLRRLKTEFDTPWPMVQLLEAADARRLALDPDGLRAIADYAVGVGLPFATLIETGPGNARLEPSALAQALMQSGLAIHPYTMRRDVPIAGAIGYFDALRFLIRDLQVDAIFCDHPDDALSVRAGNSA